MINAKNLLILLLSSSLLSGCTTFGLFDSIDPIKVQTIAADKLKLNISDPAPIKPKELKWFIITPENAEQIFAELQKKSYDVVLFGLTDDGYKDLSLNFAEMRKYLLEEKGIIGDEECENKVREKIEAVKRLTKFEELSD